MRRRRSAWAVLRWPALFALLSGAGLLLGLMGEGARDAASWLLLGSVPAFILIAFARPAPRARLQPVTITESTQCTCVKLACPCSSSSLRSPAPPGRKTTIPRGRKTPA